MRNRTWCQVILIFMIVVSIVISTTKESGYQRNLTFKQLQKSLIRLQFRNLLHTITKTDAKIIVSFSINNNPLRSEVYNLRFFYIINQLTFPFIRNQIFHFQNYLQPYYVLFRFNTKTAQDNITYYYQVQSNFTNNHCSKFPQTIFSLYKHAK